MTAPSLTTTLSPGVRAELMLSPIDDLISATRDGFRLYELFRLRGPDDLLNYVDVAATCDKPEQLDWWPEQWLPDERPAIWQTRLESPPWRVAGQESSAEHQAWLRSGLVEKPPELAAARWPEILAARTLASASSDPLVCYELNLIAAGEHENDLALKEPNLSPWLDRHCRWRLTRHYADPDYQLLTSLLAHPAIESFSHRGSGDWFAIKAACAEQFRRTNGNIQDRNAAAETFPVRVLAPWSGRSLFDEDSGDRFSLNERPAWTHGVRFQVEGIELAGLCLDDGGCGAKPMAHYERESTHEEVLVLLTRYDGLLTPHRSWYRTRSGLQVGLLPEMVSVLSPLLQNDGILTLNPDRLRPT